MLKVAGRAAVPPFEVMNILDRVAQLRAAGRDVISLCAGEPSGGAPQDVQRLAAQAHTDRLELGYTSALGLRSLREAVAEHYRAWYGLEVPAERVAITTGSSGAFVLAFLAAFDGGDRVALARPGYPAYRNILRALGCEVVEIDCGPADRFQPTPAALDAVVAATGPLDGLVLASPANPTGTMVTREELGDLTRWCARHGVRLVSDEIYHGITYPADPAAPDARGVSAWEVDRGAVVVSSFSKYWGMTGWRLGWLVLPDDLIEPVYRLAGNVALCPPALPQYAALAAFTPEAMAAGRANVHRYAETRAFILSRLDDLGWNTIAPADGAFYIYANIAHFGLDAVTYCERLLEEAGVALTPGTDFDPARGHDWVRLSFAVSLDVVKQAIDRIAAWQRTL